MRGVQYCYITMILLFCGHIQGMYLTRINSHVSSQVNRTLASRSFLNNSENGKNNDNTNSNTSNVGGIQKYNGGEGRLVNLYCPEYNGVSSKQPQLTFLGQYISIPAVCCCAGILGSVAVGVYVGVFPDSVRSYGASLLSSLTHWGSRAWNSISCYTSRYTACL